MKHTLHVYCVTIFCVTSTIVGFAKDDVHRITLEDAVRIALQNNHDLMAAQIEMERANTQVTEAVGYALPRLDLAATYTRALKKPVFFLPDFDDPESGKITPIEIGSNHSFDMTLTASQVLFNSSVFIGVGTSKIYSQAAEEIYRSRKIETITNVRKAFYGVLLADAILAMSRENLKNAEENLLNVRVLARQGLVSEYDELRAEVGYENLRPEVIKAQNDWTLSLNNLKIAMGIRFTQEIKVIGNLAFKPVQESFLETAIETSIDSNPALAAMRFQADVNDAIVSVERSKYLPTLSAFGNYQFAAQNEKFRITDAIGSSIVGLTLSMNVFSGFQRNARIEQAKLDLRRSQEEIAAFETRLQTSVESNILQMRRAQERVEAQQRTVEQAEKGYRIATSRFTSGSGTQLEVNDAQLALTQAKVNRIQAVHDYLMASADLDAALGKLPEYVSDVEG